MRKNALIRRQLGDTVEEDICHHTSYIPTSPLTFHSVLAPSKPKAGFAMEDHVGHAVYGHKLKWHTNDFHHPRQNQQWLAAYRTPI